LEIVDERPIRYADFCNLDSIQYFLSQLRGSKLKNLKSDGMKDNTTKKSYVQQIYRFNNWLHGKTFEFSTTKQIDMDTFKKTKENITLDGIDNYYNSTKIHSTLNQNISKL
jgi:glutaredoxin 2